MASESPSSFGSHNPFRRKTSTTDPVTTDHAASPSTLSSSAHTPSSSSFARALTSLGSTKTDAPPPAVTFAKPKPVKKVRVQSPPPSSPESAGAEHPYPKYPLPPREDDDETSAEEEDINGESEDPFMNEAPPLPEEALAGVGAERLDPVQLQQQTQSQAYTGRGPPPNPFQKTLEDMERDAREGGQGTADPASSAGKPGLDVEAFKRLLLTGQGPTPSPGGETGSLAETSSTSRQSIFETTNTLQETPRTSHETEPEDDKASLVNQSAPAPQRASSRRKKPPPPPATRHGKLIKMELKDKARATGLEDRPSVGFVATGPTPTSPPRDVNKPLPVPPEDDAVRNSIFDKEAAGKLPEVDIDPEADVVPPPRPPTPPNASHSSSTPVQSPPPSTLRKPMPPPRRTGHGRTDSKPQDDIPDDPATTPPRSSLESQRSRSSSIRLNFAAPTPPPPRRAAGHRQSPSVSSPISASATSPSFPFPTTADDDDEAGPAMSSSSFAPKASPPVPPPQRNPSLRKSASAALNRKGHGAVPPPPPPRTRGGSKGSTDGGPGLSRTRSVESTRPVVGPVTEEGEMVEGVDTAASDDAVRAMLADLDALQREVDAARARAEGGGG
ncbi:hypothetical protein N0V93_008273 [Gnomoniopsis smithogilvyi]|uniref:Uncharacterized protein n=1 Tax=Gnomoniopsis smithogilvyi TaxID=1191159 RepID=A0A9W9CTJ1_9PEZI|nr:hypothetical protein N0V93_008273 [Gnomoniopsis smithogilvyi]